MTVPSTDDADAVAVEGSGWRTPSGYTIGAVLERGAFAVVYRGTDPDGGPVAIKVLDSARPQARERFLREIKVTQNLPEHPRVVRYLDEGRLEDDTPYLVLELIEGFVLTRVMDADRRLGERGACDLMLQLCEAFGGLHKLGLTHGDIKPDNIMIDRDKRSVKLLDFGLVRDAQGLLKLMEEEEMIAGNEFEENLDVGMIAGTPDYIAPETIADARRTSGETHQTDTPADVFGLGVILHELLCRKRPWPFRPTANTPVGFRKEAKSYLDSRIDANPVELERPAHVTTALWSIVCKALHSNPKQRQHDAKELRRDIERYVESGTGVPGDLDLSDTLTFHLDSMDLATGDIPVPVIDTRQRHESKVAPAPKAETKAKADSPAAPAPTPMMQADTAAPPARAVHVPTAFDPIDPEADAPAPWVGALVLGIVALFIYMTI